MKYLYNKNNIITDYGKSIKYNEYFLTWMNYDEEEIEEFKTFNTEKELIKYLKKHGIKEEGDRL